MNIPLLSNRFFKNASWLLFGRVFQMMIQFIIGIITARYLGPSNYGIVSYVASYITFFASVVSFGLNGVLINELVQNKDDEGDIVGTAILLRFIVGVLSSFSVVSIIGFIEGFDSKFLIIAVLMAIQLPITSLDTINHWYQSKLLSKYSVIVQTIAFVFVASYKTYILITKKSTEWFAFSTTLNVFIMAVAYYYSYKKRSSNSLQFSKYYLLKLLRQCFPFLLANLMVQIYAQTDKIMIRILLASTERVGIYTVCTTISHMISILPLALIDSGRPIVMELKAKGSKNYEIRLRQLIAVVVWISFLYSFFVTLLSPQILHLLYGSEYISGSTCLRIIVWYTAFSYLGGIRSIWLICEKKNMFVFWLSMMGAFTNVLFNFILIPRYGIEGAAVATLLAQVMANLLYPSFFKETRGFSKIAVQGIFLSKANVKL